MLGEENILFSKYVKSKEKIIYPWSLSILDCYFLTNALFAVSGSNGQISMLRQWGGEESSEKLVLRNAYDLYDADTAAYGSEVVIAHEESGSYCYWDLYERFVIASGPELFIMTARPYPRDIEEHRYIEDMSSFQDLESDPAIIYQRLISLIGN